MIPTKITINGALGIKAGLGRDELTLDLAALIPEDAVTVALKGDNGSGKSTLFNLAFTPWREPPMLSGTLYDEFADTGLRELEFDHGGIRYRSRIEIKQTAKTKSCKAFLHVITDGEWQSVTLPDNTVSDGKTRTFDACLEYVLGPQSLYYMSAFRAQGAAKLGEHDDPKGLMRDLLALEEPQTLRERARGVTRELRREYEHVRGDYERLEEKSGILADLTLKTSTLENELPTLVQAKTTAAETAALARAAFESATQDDADNVQIRKQREAVEQRIQQAKASLASTVATADGDVRRANQRLEQEVAAGHNRKQQIQRRIDAAEQLLTRRDEIERAAADADALAVQIPERESALEELRKQAGKVIELTGTLQTLKSRLDHNANSGKSLAAKCADLQQRAGYVDQVPCGGAAPYDTCPALRNAIEAKGLIPGVESDIEAKRTEWRELNDQARALNDQLDSLSACGTDLKVEEQKLARIRRQLDTLRQTAALASGIQQAEESLGDARMELQSADLSHSDTMEDIQAELTALTERVATVRTEGDAAVAALETELNALPVPDPAGRLIAARRELEQAEQVQTQAAGAVDQKNADIAEAKARAGTLKAEIDAGDSIHRHAQYLAEEIAHWNLLAVGLQGVIDLSIEDAGPAISNTANGLLAEAYGPRFTTSIVTQREQANGRLVECFDISVIDAESGIESSILKKSGGESVWLDKALTDAVGLYHQDAAGIHYECLFADESEDGLTQDRKAQFYRMDRAALQLGGYRRKFFVSHNPEAWAMADTVIDLGGMVK